MGWRGVQLPRCIAETAWGDVAASREPSEADGFSDSLSSTGQHEVNVTLHEDKHANIGIYFLGTFNLHMRNLTDAEKLQDSPRFTYCYFVSICFIICSLSNVCSRYVTLYYITYVYYRALDV